MVHSEESKTAVGKPRGTITRDMPPPALVIEVVSPGAHNRARDYRHKHTEYAARCILDYWIVDPQDQRVTLCKWIDGAYEDTVFKECDRLDSDILPTFDLTVEQLFSLKH
ncbi:MAG TPA: Uma2 family endonuclease [Elainellaceae cyanobacterium]|jgi:Uma2 family endonuclease